MKAILNLLAWGAVSAVILHTVLRPDGGVIYQSPMSALGLGLIGLGLCLEMRKRHLTAAAAVPSSDDAY